MYIENRLESIGKTLPDATRPVANYRGTTISGDHMYVSGHVSDICGEVGTQVNVDEAYTAAEQATLACLGTVNAALGGLDRVESVVRLTGYVRAAGTFVNMPAVIDGASDLLVAAFAERGHHSRAAIGVKQLPFGASVEIEMMLKLAPAT